MHKSATKCNETIGKWCKNKHGASKIIDTLETYQYVLVMDPTFVGPANHMRFSKVIIDNGSSINIRYRDMMQKLGIKENMLEPSQTTFHGIVLGLS
jgi:hypothetical protein